MANKTNKEIQEGTVDAGKWVISSSAIAAFLVLLFGNPAWDSVSVVIAVTGATSIINIFGYLAVKILQKNGIL